MEPPISAQARLAQYDPYAYRGQQDSPVRPVERYDDYPVEYYRPPQYPMPYRQYRPPMESRDKVQMAVIAICAVFVLSIFAGIMFAWVSQPPAPIVTNNEPNCVVFCG
ncbi:MAG: hypothetical protein ACREQ5_01795 [Candidatus Dormibacteria bacterium]